MRRWGDKGGSSGGLSLCWEDCFIIQPILNPGHDIFDVCRGWQACRLPICIKPGIIKSGNLLVVFDVWWVTRVLTYPGPADIDGQFLTVQNSVTTP